VSLPFDKTLRRVYLSTWDFEQARDFIDAALKHDEATLEYRALLLSAIICYARPFSRNEIGKDPAADPKLRGVDVPAVLEADFTLHETIVRLRNIAVAHSASEVNPSERVPTPPGRPGSYGIVFSARRWHPVDEQIDLEAFRRIAETMLRKCKDMIVEVPRKEAMASNRERRNSRSRRQKPR
jgi:hypothetical protein